MKCLIFGVLLFFVYTQSCSCSICDDCDSIVLITTSENFTLIGFEDEKHQSQSINNCTESQCAIKWETKENDDFLPVLFTPKENNFNYSYIGIDADRFTFEVEATNDVHIGLFSSPSDNPPWYEIVIGGWGNSKSVIRKDKVLYPQLRDNDVVTALTPGIVKTKEPNKIWVRFNKFTVSAGFEGEDAFIGFRDIKPIPKIKYIGFHVGFGSNGKWRINIPRVSRDDF